MTEAERMNLEIFEGVMQRIEAMAQEAMIETMRPSVLFKPKLFKDGSAWCMLYGEDLQIGVSGFGDTPALAAKAFDKEWNDGTH